MKNKWELRRPSVKAPWKSDNCPQWLKQFYFTRQWDARKNLQSTARNHSVKSSQPVGEDKYAFVQRLKEFLYSFFHALPINSIHKPLISIKIEFISKVLILSLFIVEMFDF